MPKNNQTAHMGILNRLVAKGDAQMGTLVANIQSLLQQLQAMVGADAQGEVEMEEGTDTNKPVFTIGSPAPSQVEGEEEEEATTPGGTGEMPAGAATPEQKKVVRGAKAKKAIIVGDPDALIGSGDAEERIEDIPEEDEENVDAVAKGIIRLLTGKGGPVNKSVGRPTADGQQGVMQMLAALTNAVQMVAKSQAQQGQVIEDLLEGMGVTQQLDVKKESAAKKPVQAVDQSLVIKELVNGLIAAAGVKLGDAAKTTKALNTAEAVRSGLSDVVKGLAQNATGLWPE